MLRFLWCFSNRLKELANITTTQALVKDIKYAVCAKNNQQHQASSSDLLAIRR